MTLDEKRFAVEVLLCAARYVDSGGSNRTTRDVCELMGISRFAPLADKIGDWWYACDRVNCDHGTVCIESAYRLIETSATLRREWFGAR